MMPEHIPDDSRVIDRRMALAREWDDLVGQVRALDDFKDFLKPPQVNHLLPAAESDSMVIVNVSKWRCDAIIVTTAGVEVKKLPGLTAGAISVWARAYIDDLQRVEDAYRALDRQDSLDQPLEEMAAYTAARQSLREVVEKCEETLRRVTEWLWDQIAEPVLATVGATSTPSQGQQWPRLWWCPTGLLTFLPLHAAGHHTPEGRAHHESVLDRLVPSYTPTLRALSEARRRDAQRAGTAATGDAGTRRAPAQPAGEQMLIVALADAPGQAPLPSVDREHQLLAKLFQANHTSLVGPRATWDAVSQQLQRHRWVHFSCHGNQNLADPSRGGILLYDRPLTIADISRGQYGSPRLSGMGC